MEGLLKIPSGGRRGEGELDAPPPPLDIHSASVETMQQSLQIAMDTKEHSLTYRDIAN